MSGGWFACCADKSLDLDTVTAICKEYKYHCADVKINMEGATIDDLIDAIEGNRWGIYYKCI